ncbi:glycoside hydrolase family 43 protein [Actinoplanes sp. NPDC026670]|uniref:glycoside hydrolase family 43 protein n=1 Tax=Actinoplanes sp. NPDC026670 TaxID=3154700 RepID=UPI003400A099
MNEHPILRGFHPDPSAVRAGTRYVLATSTFEWSPGIALHTSTDLRRWQPIGGALNLDLRGVPDSAGIWAPTISHHDGLFWLVYTVVRTMTGAYKDLDNYLVTAPDPAGPWSEPIYLNSSGFDPSLFHAADGRRYLINVNWDHRPGRFSFGGVLLQEYDHDRRSLVGDPKVIFASDELMEGSHLFERDGWFYLMLAEGGTGYHHGIRLARSRDLRGPYQVDSEPLLTARHDPQAAVQKAGHGQLLTTPDGEQVIVHLGARPRMGRDGLRSPLGRETFLQHVVWTPDGWLRLLDKPVPASEHPADQPFDGPEWMSLRAPATPGWAELEPGRVRLRGRESLDSLFDQSLLARRLPGLHGTAEVTVDVEPRHFTELAGLVLYYNTTGYHYLAVTHHEQHEKVIVVISKRPGATVEHGRQPIPDGPVRLRTELDGMRVRFSYAATDGVWKTVGPALDLEFLSDEIGPPLRFTGTAIGVCAQDLSRRRLTADFSDFTLDVA